MLLNFDGRSGRSAQVWTLGVPGTSGPAKFERRAAALAWAWPSPIWPVPDLIGWVWPLRLSLCYFTAGCTQRTWKAPLNKALCTLLIWAGTSRDLQAFIYRDAKENQMCFILRSLCSPPASQRKVSFNANNFQIDALQKNACFSSIFWRLENHTNEQFQKL